MKFCHINKFFPLLFFCITAILYSAVSTYASSESHEASAIPWSGYWWPFSEGGLSTGNDYRGYPSPLEKYQLLNWGPGDNRLVSWFEEKYYDPEAPFWYGFCAYWAWAAAYEDIDFYPSSENNIIFRVGDKKGLLTLAHDDTITEAAYESSPDVFHYWLLHYIKDKGKAFVADLFTGEEVWSYPIYRYDMDSVVNGNIESVDVTIYYANDLVPPDYIGTYELESEYTYNLFRNNSGSITGGEWTGASIDSYPEKLTFPLMQQSKCPYLDYEEVLRLARSKDDFLEKPEAVIPISPGTYNLVLMDPDQYSINCLPGDYYKLIVTRIDSSVKDMVVIITDKDGNEVSSTTLDIYDDQMNLEMTAENPPYIITITQDNGYYDPNIYSLTLDMKKNFQQTVPYIPKNGMWSGFALTNPNGNQVENLTLTSYNAEGQPIQTLLGPVSLLSNEKKIFMFDELPWRAHELPDTSRLILMADAPVSLLNIFGNNQNISCLAQGSAKGSRFIIPDTALPMKPGKSMLGEIVNETFQEISITMRLYSEDGYSLFEGQETLEGKESFSIFPGDYPFYNMPDSGWIEITGPEGALLSGYQYVSTGQFAESVFGLSADSYRKIVPHITSPGVWTTSLTLINTADAENRIRFQQSLTDSDQRKETDIVLAPYEKITMELQDEFGGFPGDPWYQSILEINGDYPVAGYYSYSAMNAKADIPLMDENDFKSELILPHYPGTADWWTGVGIYNPSPIPVIVKAEAYDASGSIITEPEIQINLEPGSYETFLVKSRFGKIAADKISFIKFIAEEKDSYIGGFYLFGNNENEVMEQYEILTGANM